MIPEPNVDFGFGTTFINTPACANEASHPPPSQDTPNHVSVMSMLPTRVLIGRFHKPPLPPCLDHIAQPYTLCTNEDVDAELFE